HAHWRCQHEDLSRAHYNPNGVLEEGGAGRPRQKSVTSAGPDPDYNPRLIRLGKPLVHHCATVYYVDTVRDVAHVATVGFVAPVQSRSGRCVTCRLDTKPDSNRPH